MCSYYRCVVQVLCKSHAYSRCHLKHFFAQCLRVSVARLKICSQRMHDHDMNGGVDTITFWEFACMCDIVLSKLMTRLALVLVSLQYYKKKLCIIRTSRQIFVGVNIDTGADTASNTPDWLLGCYLKLPNSATFVYCR